jgi:hypothetical protein
MEFWRRQMPTEEKVSEKRRASHIVKVTGMSEELLGLLDARVKQQQATGGNSQLSSEQRLLEEYHALVDLELESQLSPEEQARLRVVEGTLDRIEARETETQAMFARLEETAGKLDALLAAVRALPQAEA